MEWLGLMGGFILLLFPGVSLQLAIFNEPRLTSVGMRWLISVVLGMTALPLTAFLGRYYGQIPLTGLVLVLGSVLLTLGGLLGHRRQTKDLVKEMMVVSKRDGIFGWVIGLGVCWYGYLLFGQSFTIPGGDSSHYLLETVSVMRYGLQQYSGTFDRNIVQFFPAILSLVSGLEPEMTIRIMVLMLVGVSTAAIYQLVVIVTGRVQLGWAGMVLVLVNLGYARFLLDVYAFFWGLTTVSIIFLLMSWCLKIKTGEIRGLVLIVGLWGSLFNIHGFVSFASLIMVGVPFVILSWNLRKKLWKGVKKTGTRVVIGVILFVITAQPTLFGGWHIFYKLIIKPVTMPEAIAAIREPEQKPMNRVDKPVGWKDFPLLRQQVFSYFPGLMLLMAGIGMVVIIGGLRSRVDQKMSQLWLVIVGSYILFTQQEYFGFSWVPTRFLMGLYVPLVVLTCTGLHLLIKKQGKKGWLGAVVIFLVCVGWSMKQTSAAWIAFKPTISRERYDFYKNLSKWVDAVDGPIYSLVLDPYWAPGLNPDLEIRIVNSSLVCDKPRLRNQLKKEPNNRELIQAMAFVSQDAGKADELLIKISKGKEFAVLFDVDQTCTLGLEQFFSNKFKVVAKAGSLYLANRQSHDVNAQSK